MKPFSCENVYIARGKHVGKVSGKWALKMILPVCSLISYVVIFVLRLVLVRDTYSY